MILLVGFEIIKDNILKTLLKHEDHFVERSLISFMKDFNEIDFTKIDETIIFFNKPHFDIVSLFAIIKSITTNNMTWLMDVSTFNKEENEALDNIVDCMADLIDHLYVIDENNSDTDLNLFLDSKLNES